MLDESSRVADGVGAGGARGGDSGVRAGQAEENRDVSAGGVDHQPRDGERADARDAALQQHLVLLFEGFNSADAAADQNAAAIGVFLGKIDGGIFHGLRRGGNAELAEAIKPARLARVDAVFGDVKLRAFAAEAHRIFAGVPAGDGLDAALAGAEIFPQLVNGLAERGDNSKSCDNDAAANHVGILDLRFSICDLKTRLIPPARAFSLNSQIGNRQSAITYWNVP